MRDSRKPRTQRRAHDTLHMSSDATLTAMTAPSDDTTTATTPASSTDAGEAFPRLPNHLVVAHILRSEYFDDPADLARLGVVSRAMRDVVTATGLRVKELETYKAAKLGCLSAVQRKQRGGLLGHHIFFCRAAAEGGHLEVLQLLRTDGCPWSKHTCEYAAKGGHLEVLQWARANGCPWNRCTCSAAAEGGHLELLQWARANGCPWNRNTRKYASGSVMEWVVASGVPE